MRKVLQRYLLVHIAYPNAPRRGIHGDVEEDEFSLCRVKGAKASDFMLVLAHGLHAWTSTMDDAVRADPGQMLVVRHIALTAHRNAHPAWLKPICEGQFRQHSYVGYA